MRPLISTRIIAATAFILISSLAACGGGGGGGNAGPLPGGGNGGGSTPTPSPTSTSSPGGTPTPRSTATPTPAATNTPTPRATATPTPVATATPTPMATPTPVHGTTMIADTTGRFGLAQVLDNYGGGTITTSQMQSEAPNYDFVWGSFYPSTWHAANPNIILSRYVLDSEDMSLMSGHDLTWWQANHPTWIFYACDASGNPTSDYAWDTGYFHNDVPLAYWMPEVQQYEANLYVSYLQPNGYNALAVDNMNLTNYTWGGNYNLGQTPNKTEFGCGTHDANGNFVRRYSSRSDSTYTSDTIAWAAFMQNVLHNAGMKLVINHPVKGVSPTDPNEQALISHVDGTFDENGYTEYGSLYTTGNFANTLAWVEYAQAHNKAIFITDYFCTGSGCSDQPSTLTPQQVDYALASYAIGNEGGEDVYISPHGGQDYSWRPEYANTYGAACSTYQQQSPYVYTRRFQHGMAIVNASGSTTVVNLPNHTYRDIENRPISNPLTVSSPDAFMLLTTENGCS